MLYQRIIDCIDDYELADAFKLMDAQGIKSPVYAQMKKEFQGNRYDSNFAERLKAFVIDLNNKGLLNEENALKKEGKAFVKNDNAPQGDDAEQPPQILP